MFCIEIWKVDFVYPCILINRVQLNSVQHWSSVYVLTGQLQTLGDNRSQEKRNKRK